MSIGELCNREVVVVNRDEPIRPVGDCKPLVDPPTYDAIYAQILRPTCASAATCHSSGSVRGGLSSRSPWLVAVRVPGPGTGDERPFLL